ncbi:MAG: carbohydrate binding domain-containing protein [Thermogutta sp.]
MNVTRPQLFVLVVGLLLSTASRSVSFAGEAKPAGKLFPFVLSYEAGDSITNISHWLEKPAGKHGFIRTEKGHFVHDAGRIRFWATNLCFEACFPTKEEAERLAKRLASLGINCVRMHHMDSRHIWGKSPNKLTIDPEMLDKLDYLIYQLKQNGIYTDLNLHVSREFGPAEGFPDVEGLPKYDKGIDNFEPRMIEYQKKYARDLLTHVNPYTGTAYINEPAIAMVEINNENAAFDEYRKGAFDRLPEPYASQLRTLWNTWLKKKYSDDEALRKAWNAERQPLGAEILKAGDFSGNWQAVWSLQRDQVCEVTTEIVSGTPQNKSALRINVIRNGEQTWIPQLSQGGFPVKKGQVYTFVFWLKTDKPGRIDVNCMMNHDPWQRLGLSADVQTSTQWREYRLSFVAEQDDPNARVTFSQLRPGIYELTGVSLRPGGVVGLEEGQSLAEASVPIVPLRGPLMTASARADFADFLWDLERDYWWDMYRFLKEGLNLKPLVSGTQLSYSPVHIQAGLDYIDAHSYWQHPAFPGRPWDPENWYVRNVALVNSPGGTLASLANRRVEGFAFTVSEYNHPAPNQFAAEGFPMIAAFGAFQDWDGIFSFTYSHSREYEPRKITGFFDIKSEVSKLVHMPACAAFFFRGDVQPAKQAVIVGLPRQTEQAILRETLNPWTLTADRLGISSTMSLLHRVAMTLDEKAVITAIPQLPNEQKIFVSDTQEICWDVSRPGAGVFLVSTPRTKLVTGFPAGRTFNLAGVQVQIGETTLGWSTVSLTLLEGNGFDQPGRSLLAATGKIENTGWDFRQEGERATVGRRWGDEPILCEGVAAQITLPVRGSQVKVYALDESGRRKATVPVASAEEAVIEIGPQYQTLWYEIEIAQ